MIGDRAEAATMAVVSGWREHCNFQRLAYSPPGCSIAPESDGAGKELEAMRWKVEGGERTRFAKLSVKSADE
jgi:hypothetical protein